MHLPKVGFKWDLTLGNVIQMVALAGALITGWFALNTKADEAVTMANRVPGLEARLTAVETSTALLTQTIEVGRTARLTFQASVAETFKSIEEDRREQSGVNAEVLAQLRVIVSRLDAQLAETRLNKYQGPFAPAWLAAADPVAASLLNN